MVWRRLVHIAIGACAFGMVCPADTIAQVQPAALTLQAATDLAFSANPTIAAARLTRAVNLAGLAVAAERLNPEATVELEKETPKQAFGVAVPLELGGKRAKRIALGEATLRTGDATLDATIAQVRNDVRRAYFALVVASTRLGVLQESRDLALRIRDAAQARFDNGDAPRLEILQAELAVAAAENEVTAAGGIAAAARSRLNALIGQPLDADRALSTPAGGGGPIVAADVLQLASTRSTELAVIDRQIEEQRARLTLAGALRVPDVVPTATLTHDAQPEFLYGWRAGVAFTVPFFTTHRAGVQVERASLDQLVAQRQATLVRINSEVTAAAAEAESQRAAYARYRDTILPQAQAVEQLAQDSYQLGQTGIAALLQALQSTRDIRLRSLDAASGLQTALADLERAVGAPIP